MKRVLSILVSIFSCSFYCFSQPAVQQGFRSLELGRSAREMALSGKTIAVGDHDPQLGFYTPSLISSSKGNAVVLSFADYLSDIGFGHVGYQFKIKDVPVNFMGGINFFSYGTFDRRDEQGTNLGTFTANDYQFRLGGSYEINNKFTAGGYLKVIHSSLAGYTSSAFATDISITYFNDSTEFYATFLIQNMGFALSQSQGEKQTVPLNLHFGLSKKLENAPFRFHLTLDNLRTWDLVPESDKQPTRDPLTGELIPAEEKSFTDKLMRHAYTGIELVITQNFHFRFGYNYRRRQEMKLDEKPGSAGIGWGVEFRINRFKFSYARSAYHLANTINQFSVSTSLQKFGL